MDTRELFQTNLKRIRKEKGMTQAQLAREIHKPTSYIGSLEATGKFPGADAIDAITGALGVDVWEMFTEDRRQRYNTADYAAQINSLQEDMVRSTQRAIDNVFARVRTPDGFPLVMASYQQQFPALIGA